MKFAKSMKIPYFRGVFMKDNLPKKVHKRENGVLNLDNYAGKGTHWVCYCKRNNLVLYYDSFGVQPPVELLFYLGPKCKIMYNFEQEQKVTDVICGHLCLLYLLKNG